MSVFALCTREAGTEGNMCHCANALDRDGCKAIRLGAIAELLHAVCSPTPDVAAAAHSTTVMVAAGELANVGKTTNEPQGRGRCHRARGHARCRFWRGFGLAWSGGEREGEDPPTVVFLTLLNAGVLGSERAGIGLDHTDERLRLMRAAALSWSPTESCNLLGRRAGA